MACEHSRASWISWKWSTSRAVAFGRRTRRTFASTTVRRVPSDPTISRAMLTGRGGYQLVQVVAGDAAPVRRVPGADVLRVLVADARDLPVDLPLEARLSRLRWRTPPGETSPKRAERAIGEDGRHVDHVLDGEPIGDGVGAARVVADHAAQGGAARRGGVGAEQEASPSHVSVQVVLHDDPAGLAPTPPPR